MFQIASALRDEGRYQPVLLLTDLNKERAGLGVAAKVPTYILSQSSEAEENCQVESRDTKTENVSGRSFGVVVSGWLQKIYRGSRSLFSWLEKTTNNRILSLSLYHAFRAVPEIFHTLWYEYKVDRFLNRYQPVAVYTYTDNGGGMMAYFCKQCVRRGIKIILPPAAFSHPNAPASFRHRGDLMAKFSWRAPWINLVLKRFFPGQFYLYEGAHLSFYYAYEVLAMILLRLLPPYPWTKGKNFAAVTGVEDYHQFDRLVQTGIPPERLSVTGHVDCDTLFVSAQGRSRDSFFSEYGFDSNKKLIIVAPTQLFEHQEVETWEEQVFETDYFVRSATDTGHNVLVVLHPKMDRQRYSYLEARFPCRIHSGETATAVPFGDIFVASGSSTLLWAVQCGLIGVNIGIYNCRIDAFFYMKSVINIFERDALGGLLSRLTGDEEYFQECLQNARRDKNDIFLPLDGLTMRRILDLL